MASASSPVPEDIDAPEHSDNESIASEKKENAEGPDSKQSRTALPADDIRRTTPKVLLSNLTQKITEAHLREICGHFGAVANVTLAAEETAQRAIVEFEKRTEAQDAVDFMHRMTLDDVIIFCSFTIDSDPLNAVALSAWGQPSEVGREKSSETKDGGNGRSRNRRDRKPKGNGEAGEGAAAKSASASQNAQGGRKRRDRNVRNDRGGDRSSYRDRDAPSRDYRNGRDRDGYYRDNYRDGRGGRDDYRRDSYRDAPRDNYRDGGRDGYRGRDDYDDGYKRGGSRDGPRDDYRKESYRDTSRDSYRSFGGRYGSPERDRYGNDGYRGGSYSSSSGNNGTREDYDSRRARSPPHRYDSDYSRSPPRDYDRPSRRYDDPPEAKRYAPYDRR